MSRLQFHHVHKRYGDGPDTIRDLHLELPAGAFSVFIGPSGCGKSTVLRMIAGLEDISEGEIRIDGARVNEVAPAQRGVAMVFQSYALYPHMTVAENIFLGREPRRWGSFIDWPTMFREAKALLDRFKVELDPAAEVRTKRVVARWIPFRQRTAASGSRNAGELPPAPVTPGSTAPP
jgi:ABC-type sugar transport system ATPase subunit